MWPLCCAHAGVPWPPSVPLHPGLDGIPLWVLQHESAPSQVNKPTARTPCSLQKQRYCLSTCWFERALCPSVLFVAHVRMRMCRGRTQSCWCGLSALNSRTRCRKQQASSWGQRWMRRWCVAVIDVCCACKQAMRCGGDTGRKRVGG